MGRWDWDRTGVRGTIELFPILDVSVNNNFNVWMGVWVSYIFSFSSNWKYMYTLLYVLQNEATRAPICLRHKRIFYLTDNMTTYYIFRKGTSESLKLIVLLRKINILELCLQCFYGNTCIRVNHDITRHR